MSTTPTLPQAEGWLPEQRPGWSVSSQAGRKLGSGVSSHVVQSLPGVPGQGTQGEPALITRYSLTWFHVEKEVYDASLLAFTTETSRRNRVHCPH